MHVHGKCHCGAITLTAEVDPKKALLCHCTDCQVLSGSAYRTLVPARADGFKILSGKPKSYVKTADSGAKRAQVFCPDCGTALYSIPDEGDPEIYMLRVGMLAERDALQPRTQIWTHSAQEWSGDLSGVKAFAGQFE
ncbi:MAG: GFA family protein [Gammaproteobacteria bacterium]|jgi:hypothetical protein